MNGCFLGLSVQLFSEGKLYSSTSLIYFYCIAYRNNIVSWRNVQIHPETRQGHFWSTSSQQRDISEAQVNITEDNEDLNVNSESESELHEVQPTSWN